MTKVIIKTETHDASTLLTAMVAGHEAGSVKLLKTSYGYLYLSRLYVLPEARQLGVGRALMRGTLERYGHHRIELVCSATPDSGDNGASHEALVRFYQSLGFCPGGSLWTSRAYRSTDSDRMYRDPVHRETLPQRMQQETCDQPQQQQVTDIEFVHNAGQPFFVHNAGQPFVVDTETMRAYVRQYMMDRNGTITFGLERMADGEDTP
jgi:GNAT superfamily N-acetyltransferase